MGRNRVTTVSVAELAKLSKVIDLIYEGAIDPDRWDGILPVLANWLDAPRGWLFTPMHVPGIGAAGGGYSFTHAFAPSMAQTWRDKWHTQDLWAMRAAELGKFVEGNVFRGDELLPESAITPTEVYREFMLPNQIHYLLSGLVFGTTSPGMMPTACSFFRGLGDKSFTRRDSDKMRILLPHISRSLGVAQRLRDADLKVAASLAALDKLSAGVLLIGRSESVEFANRAAQRMLAEDDGMALRYRAGCSNGGKLLIDDTNTARAVRVAVKNAIAPDVMATEHFCRFITIPRPSGRAPYSMHFSSLPEKNEFSASREVPRVIVFITDSAAPVTVDAEVLKQTYGLTPAEIRVAVTIAQGQTLKEMSSSLNVTTGTLKSHLKRVYDKTRTDSRAKLVKFILSVAVD